MSSQGLLFAEPTVSETGLWRELSDGIDPERWARLCRYLGSLSPKDFKKVEKHLFPGPDSLKNRFKRLFCFDQADCEGLPLVCFGPENSFIT
ncbi:MAG: hypothetical protein OEV87_00595 [Phycisphaerae bacterium]|nr:hypothetical protein [Phycisphaerae bacterium]